MQVLKYRLHEGLNTIPSPGTSKLVMLDYQDSKLFGWILETHTDQQDEYEVYVALTGEQVPPEYNYVVSTQTQRSGGYYVVHAFD
jgi:hypothetical protein